MISSSSLSHVNGFLALHGCLGVGEHKYGAQSSDPATRRVCVFAGSGLGSRQVYQQGARDLGKELVQHKLGSVYGGASVGLMGEVAAATLRAGSEVIAVVPRGLWSPEATHSGKFILV